MKSALFEQAVHRITERRPSVHRDAYFFLKEALDLALAEQQKNPTQNSHVTAAQLAEAFATLALDSYGPMALTVLNEWGLYKTQDIGTMVFDLIDEKMFGRQKSDSHNDFEKVYLFSDKFEKPYLPHGIEEE